LQKYFIQMEVGMPHYRAIVLFCAVALLLGLPIRQVLASSQMSDPPTLVTQTELPVSEEVPTETPTVTWTPACSMSGGITTTDLFLHQNVVAYDCMYGCNASPHLQQAGSFFVAGTYYWKVETVGSTSVQINNGSFFLPNNSTYIGPRANPQPGDIVVPLGRGMYNMSSIQQNQVVKVTMWAGTESVSCAAKTDNFKVLESFASPMPTITRTSTATATVTATVTPTITRTSTATVTVTTTVTPTITRTFVSTPTPTLTRTLAPTRTSTPTITDTPEFITDTPEFIATEITPMSPPTVTRVLTITPMPLCFDC
jgi:hypothetical protein